MDTRSSARRLTHLLLLGCGVVTAPYLAVTGTAAKGLRSGGGSCSDSAATEAQVNVVLRVVNRSGLDRSALKSLETEAAHIWRSNGVALHWSNGLATGLPGESPIQMSGDKPVVSFLDVTFSPELPGQLPSAKRRPLAAIVFVNGAPTSNVMVFPEEADRLLAEVRSDDRLLAQRPVAVHSDLLGRMLGRALAHEIGHYLFHSAAHAESGLMRANQRTDLLIGLSDRPFRLIAPGGASCWATASGEGSGHPTDVGDSRF